MSAETGPKDLQLIHTVGAKGLGELTGGGYFLSGDHRKKIERHQVEVGHHVEESITVLDHLDEALTDHEGLLGVVPRDIKREAKKLAKKETIIDSEVMPPAEKVPGVKKSLRLWPQRKR